MVGVPGRSKGCNTCIQRKIRCDQETPPCGNCRKSNRPCGGYKRRLGYVFSHDVSLLAANLVEPLCSREETSVAYRGRWKGRSKSQELPFATGQDAEPPPARADNPLPPSIGRQISPSTALRQQYHYIFLNRHLPAEMLDNSRPKSILTMNYFLQLQEMEIQTPALQSSMAAFFGARVGRINGDMDLVHRSRALYWGGVEQLQRALRNPQTRLSDETLAACMVLSAYELTECPVGTKNAYMAHQRGAIALLQMRGPDASASPLGHSLFLGLRSQTITASTINRRETFLSRPEWMERPWKLLPKSQIEEIIEPLLDFRVILQQSDEVSRETDQTALHNGLLYNITKCLEVESAFRGLYEKFEQSVSGPFYWPELSTLGNRVDDDDTGLGKVFPVSFYFPTFFAAQFMTTHWACTMAVHHQLRYSYDKLVAIESASSLTTTASPGPGPTTDCLHLWPPTSADVVPSPNLNLNMNLRSSRQHSNEVVEILARNICQSIEYFLQDKMGGLAPLVILTPLRECKNCLEESGPVGRSKGEVWSREIGWIVDCMDRIQKRYNFPVDKIMED